MEDAYAGLAGQPAGGVEDVSPHASPCGRARLESRASWSGVSLIAAAPMFSSRCATELVPGIGTAGVGWGTLYRRYFDIASIVLGTEVAIPASPPVRTASGEST